MYNNNLMQVILSAIATDLIYGMKFHISVLLECNLVTHWFLLLDTGKFNRSA